MNKRMPSTIIDSSSNQNMITSNPIREARTEFKSQNINLQIFNSIPRTSRNPIQILRFQVLTPETPETRSKSFIDVLYQEHIQYKWSWESPSTFESISNGVNINIIQSIQYTSTSFRFIYTARKRSRKHPTRY